MRSLWCFQISYGSDITSSTKAKTMAERATASCYCNGVQIEFPVEGDGLVDTFICNCKDCRKITHSMFASNFIIKEAELKHLKGKELLKEFSQSETIATGNTMSNHFCSKCGTLLYRVSSGFPGMYITRIGTVDDFKLHETKLKPKHEQFTKDRVSWLKGAEGVEQHEGNFYSGGKESHDKKTCYGMACATFYCYQWAKQVSGTEEPSAPSKCLHGAALWCIL
nr:hypothetical protein CFP56_68341 [Quercus suber]